MANEYTCSMCRGDATRCACHRLHPPPFRPSDEQLRQERIARNDAEIAINMAKLARLSRPRG